MPRDPTSRENHTGQEVTVNKNERSTGENVTSRTTMSSINIGYVVGHTRTPVPDTGYEEGQGT